MFKRTFHITPTLEICFHFILLHIIINKSTMHNLNNLN